jgi:hypothetical protein
MAHLEVLKRGTLCPESSYDEYRNLCFSIMKHGARHCNLELQPLRLDGWEVV